MNQITITQYAIFSAILIFFLWTIVVNFNSKGGSKIPAKPKIKRMKLFTGKEGLSNKKINEIYNIKPK